LFGFRKIHISKAILIQVNSMVHLTFKWTIFKTAFSLGLEFSFSSVAIFTVSIHFSLFRTILVLSFVLISELLIFFVLVFVFVHENSTKISALIPIMWWASAESLSTFKGKGLSTCYSTAYMSRLVNSSALQYWK